MEWLPRVWAYLADESNRDVLAFIGGGLAVLAAGAWTLYTHFSKPGSSRSATATDVTESGAGNIDNKAVHGNVNPLIQEYEPTELKRVNTPNTQNISKLTVEQITDKINRATPFQSENVAQSFIGIKVNWSGRLCEVKQSDSDLSKIRIELRTKKRGLHSIYFTTSLDEYPEFKVLEKDTLITVCGVIENASGPGLDVALQVDDIIINDSYLSN